MPDNLLIPSVDLRVGALEEYNRTQKQKAMLHHKKPKPRPCVTISRQFGCLGYPVAERVCELMSRKSGEPWLLIDRAVLDEVAKHHNISKDILESLGEKNRLLDDILAAFSPRWTHSQDCFRLLCKHVVSLAEQGNVIIMELGGAIITRHFEHSKHFRIYGSMDFKVRAIAQRLQIEYEAAEKMVIRQQKQRDAFTRDFLDQDDHNPALYELLFNNDRNSVEKIAITIAAYVADELL
ncbi:cytidylate kinase-like family protein [Trichlorobacter lovleyi]|uniref:cytidylate kinase-like family protein n=1 Tax=Trichlorobacter lovleyi TaxID=313985 RepID=UPI00223ECF45|nr:cytidylate kinase-like family protein [Trichlorobacter lovleyi]QOX78827.1 cytidylate kinase-like family protein [Trichlorobacter lovleyi]